MAWRNVFDFRNNPEEREVKPFLDHLEDLRWMIVKMAITLAAAMVACFVFRVQLVRLVQWPLEAVDPALLNNLQSLGVADSMTISFQLAFYAGFVFSFPLLLYFLAEFVLPGLTKKEVKIVLPAVGVGFGLFLAGAAFCYFVVLPQTLAFFFKDATALGWTPTWTVREYYAFVTQFIIAFGLSFELPVAVLALVKLNIVERKTLARLRPYAAVAIFFAAAIITPTSDIMTLLLMGGPMLLLYEGCVWIAALMERREAKRLARAAASAEPDQGAP